MKKRALILLIVLSAFSLCACKRIELDASTEEAYIEYAVNAVINHDKNNMNKLERVELETEEESSWISDSESESSTNSSTNVGVNDEISGSIVYSSFEEALGNNGLSVKVKGIKECASYPESTGEELVFAITASAGSRLVVVELSMTNISQNALTLDTNGYSFKGIINGIVRTNALKAFDYALNGNSHSLAAGETKDVVLIYELNNERVSTVDKVVVSVIRDDSTYNVSVK